MPDEGLFAGAGDPSNSPGPLPGPWTAGVLIGLHSFRRDPLVALRRLVAPATYWRTAEFQYVRAQLRLPPRARVLDLGSPKDLAFILARHHGFEVVATDIQPEEIAHCQRFARAQRLDGTGAGKVHAEVQDGRSLPYSDGFFDAAYSVSVLEHITHDGDTTAIRELVRVVRPGGLVVVTAPYDRHYRETFVDGPMYERKPVGTEPIFYQRHYDEPTLKQRLLGPSGATVVHKALWAETWLPVETILTTLGKLRLLVRPFEALLARATLRAMPEGGPGRPMAVFFTLRRDGSDT